MTEVVFNLPGTGTLALSGILNRDYPVVQGVVLVVACGYVIINIVIDIIYVLLGPAHHVWASRDVSDERPSPPIPPPRGHPARRNGRGETPRAQWRQQPRRTHDSHDAPGAGRVPFSPLARGEGRR